MIQNGVHLFQRVYSLLKGLRATSLFCEFSFPQETRSPDHWHATDQNGNVFFCDKVIPIKVIYVEDQLDFLVEGGAVKSKEAVEEFLLGEISVPIDIQYVEKPLSQQPRQLRVLEHNEFVDSFFLVIGTRS